MAEIMHQTQLQKAFIVNLLIQMKFDQPLEWNDFEDAIEVIKIKEAANHQMAKEMKKKGKTAGGLISGLVKKPFAAGERSGKDGAQYNAYQSLSSPRKLDDPTESEVAPAETIAERGSDEIYEFG